MPAWVAPALMAGGTLLSALAPLLGKSSKEKRFQKYKPNQESVLDQQLAQGQQNTNFDNIENRAREQFSQKTIPSLAERFTSLGQGGQRSSAFQGALGRAGSDLESQLAGLRSQHGMQQLNMGLTPRFESAQAPGGHTFGSSLLSGLGSGAASAGGMLLGGGAGGGQMGSLMGSLFGNQPQPDQQQGQPQQDNSQLIEQLLEALGSGGQGFSGGNGMALSSGQGTQNFSNYLRGIL